MVDAFRYDAFISYRCRQPDQRWADWLVVALETYAPPRSLRAALKAQGRPSRVTRVFRDQDEISAGGDLSQKVKDALDHSRTLIVVCSRNTPGSRWVNQEVEYFESLERAARVLPFLVEGEPSEAFPLALLDNAGARIAAPAGAQARDLQPLGADVRPATGRAAREIKRRALLKLVAGVLDVGYDDLYQRHLRRRRLRAAWVGAMVGILAAGSLSFFAWTRTDIYQINAALREGRNLVVSVDDNDTVAWWVQALAYTGRTDEALRDAEAMTDSGDGQVKVLLSLADVLTQQGDTARARKISDTAIAGISRFFAPQLRAELSAYAVEWFAARGLRDEALLLAASALEGTTDIADAAERVTAVAKLARRVVEWRGVDEGSRSGGSDPTTAAILTMETARASKRGGRANQTQRLALASFERAGTVEPAALRVYLQVYLADAAAAEGIPLPAKYISDAVAAAAKLPTSVGQSQATRMAVQAFVRAGNLDAARPLLREISIQEDRDVAVETLIAGYARAGRAGDVGSLLEESKGRNALDIFGLVSAAAQNAADGGRIAMLELLDPYVSAEQQIEMRVVVAKRQRTMGRDNQKALTEAMDAATGAGGNTVTSEERLEIGEELAAVGRVADAKKVAATMTNSHDQAFVLIAAARHALTRHANNEAVALLKEAESYERRVSDADGAAAGLREIGKLLRSAGENAGARVVFGELLKLAASKGKTLSSTVADVLVELARQGERRIARITANQNCNENDRLRVYAAILSPRARGLNEN